MLVVHHLERSRSHRVLWLLEELELDYELKIYRRDPDTMLAPPQLREVHPLGKSPVVTDGDLTLAESGAILEYFASRDGDSRLVPAPDTPERLRYTYFMHYAEGSVMPPLLLKLVFHRVAHGPVPFFIKPIARAISTKVNRVFIGPQLRTHFGFLERELDGRTWFCGDQFTAADIQMSYPLEAAFHRRALEGDYPNLERIRRDMQARPAYQRALEKGGPLELAA